MKSSIDGRTSAARPHENALVPWRQSTATTELVEPVKKVVAGISPSPSFLPSSLSLSFFLSFSLRIRAHTHTHARARV